MDRPAAWTSFAIDLQSERPFRVGGATIDPVSREAKFAGGRERLQPQTLKVLIALARRRGEVVTRTGLIDSCWDGRIVGDDVINRSASLLRDFAERAGRFTIETIPRAGYRLVEDTTSTARRHSWPQWAVPALVLAVAAAGLVVEQVRTPGQSEPPTVALRPFTAGPEPETRELAAASGDALSHMLLAGSYAPKLDWPATPDAAASDDLVLSGDVRKVNEGFAAVVQLRDRRTGTVVFSRHYQASADSASLLPERIGAEMSSNLTGALAMLILDRRHPVGPDLTADMLKQIGMIVQGDDPLAAYAVSRRLAKREPNSPLSQIALAFNTGFALGALPRDQRSEATRRGRVAADNALRLAGDFGDTYVPWCLLHPQTLISQCEDRMRAGLKADPNAPFVPTFLSSLLLNVGRYRESLELARASLADHPYQPHKLRRVINLTILAGLDDAADQTFAKTRRWWPDHADIYWDRIYGYALRGDIAGASRAVSDTPDDVANFDRQSVTSVIRTWRTGDLAGLRAACTAPNVRYTSQMLCIGALAKFNDKDTAFGVADAMFPRLSTGSAKGDEQLWLDEPYAGPDAMLSAPAMKWLRSDPRYLPIVERMGLAAYWRTGRLADFCTRDPEPVCRAFSKPA